MSYDIYFVKSNKLDPARINELLEAEASDRDEHFISKALMNEVKDTLANNGLSFEAFEGKEGDYLELNFETYQICMSSSQIAISLPYWDVNSSNAISNEIEQISRVLIDNGFTGYDPQTEEIFKARQALSMDFARVNKKVNEHFSRGFSTEEKSGAWRLIKLGAILILVVFLIRLLVSVVGKIF